MTDKPAKHPGGRPTTYTPEKGDAICEWMAEGRSLKKFCEQENSPTLSTVYRWLRMHPEFSENYARAQANRADTHADEILDIADNSDIDPQQARLMVDTRKWIASKLKSKNYGDRVQHTGPDDGPIQVQRIELVAAGIADDAKKKG